MKQRIRKKMIAVEGDYVSPFERSCRHCVFQRVLTDFCEKFQEDIPRDFIAKSNNGCEHFEDEIQ